MQNLNTFSVPSIPCEVLNSIKSLLTCKLWLLKYYLYAILSELGTVQDPPAKVRKSGQVEH